MNFISFNPDDLPPELKAQLDRENMEIEVKAHMIERFVEELDEEQLLGLDALLKLMSRAPKYSIIYWRGRTEALLKERYNICAAHGVDHDKEAAAEMHPKEESTVAKGNEDAPMAATSEQAAGAELQRFDRELTFRPAMAGYEWLPQTVGIMIEYNLDDFYDEDTKEFVAFRCIKCGVEYPNIADRMLKPPDECHGCFQKAAHG